MLDRETGLDFANKEHLPTLERHLISACLADSAAFDEAAEIVEEGDFALDEHAEVFRHCAIMRSQNRQISSADLYEHLVRVGCANMRCFDGNAALWIHDTAELEPTGSRARYYATHIREAAVFRRLRGVAHEIMGYAFKPFGPAAEVLGRSESMLYDLTNAAGPKKDTVAAVGPMLQNAMVRIDDRVANGTRLMGIASAYKDIDYHLAGFRPGQMVVIGARPSVGKTALALNICSNIAMSGHPVLFFSLEMPQVEIADRLLSMGSGVSMHKINSGEGLDRDEIEHLTLAASTSGIGGCDMFVDDNPSHSGDTLLQVSRRAVRKFGIQIIAIDYLQLIRAENTRLNRNEQVGSLARKVKNIARELKLPVICLAQLNRDVETRNSEPRLSDLRDSGEIEQHADAVLLLHKHQDPPGGPKLDGCRIDAIVAKNRNGPTGLAPLTYVKNVMKFENFAHGF